MFLWSIANSAVLQAQTSQIDQFGIRTRVAMALGVVLVIIAGDTQGHPAEQSDQISCAMRRGLLVGEGRVAHCMFRKFRVDEQTWVPKHRAIFFGLEACFCEKSSNEESVLVLRWMLQKENSCGTHPRLCGLNTSMEIPAGWKSSRTLLGLHLLLKRQKAKHTLLNQSTNRPDVSQRRVGGGDVCHPGIRYTRTASGPKRE